jgi:hypothetical protein
MSHAFGQDWMPFQPDVRYTYSYLKGGQRFYSSNKSSALVTDAKGKWVSFQPTFPVDTNNYYVRYSWIGFDSLQCPLNNIGERPSPVSIALPSAIWGSTAGITTDGWARIFYSSYLKPIDSVQFNIHAALNQDFVYKPSTGATARITQKSWLYTPTLVLDSALKFETSDNQTFYLSKRNGFFLLPTLGATCPEWMPANLQLAATQGLPGVNLYKNKAKDLITWQAGDTVGYNYKVWGHTGITYLSFEYWIRYSVLQREEMYNGDSIRLTVQKTMLKRSYATPVSSPKPDSLYPVSIETVVIGYPAWADTSGRTNGPVSISETGFFYIHPESSSFKDLVLGHTRFLSETIDHQPVEVRGGKRVYSYVDRGVLLDTCPALIRHKLFILDAGSWASSFSEGFGQILTDARSVMGYGYKFELDCYRMNGAGTGCTPLLILSTDPSIKPETWELFPNPGTHTVHLKGAAWKTVTIRDVQGKTWVSQDGNRPDDQIDVSQLPSGLYFMSITGQQGETQQLKWVKE